MARLLEIRLSLPVVAPLVDALLPLARGTPGEVVVPIDLAGVEDDLREHWCDDLAAGLAADLAVFTRRFGESFRATGRIELPEEECEPLIRACSALRLKLRGGPLRQLPDSALESGEVDPRELAEPSRVALTAYVFLATLQEILVRHLDPPADGAGVPR